MNSFAWFSLSGINSLRYTVRIMFVYAIVFRQTSLKILSPSSNENCFCAQSVFCPFDSWLTYFATTVIIEYWNIFQWPLLQRPNVFTQFFLYGMCQNSDYTRQSLDHTLLQSTAPHCTKLHQVQKYKMSNSRTAQNHTELHPGTFYNTRTLYIWILQPNDKCPYFVAFPCFKDWPKISPVKWKEVNIKGFGFM